MACDEAGIRFIHGVEIYLTEHLGEKVRDNYHTVLLARNMAGVLELNRLVSKSCDKEHFYYTNRISFDEFLSISGNILSASACLASPLNKLPEDHPKYGELVRKYDFLEVQPHNHPDQIAFNKKLLRLSREYRKPLIAGTDTHSSSGYKAECRSVLLEAKHKSYGDENAFDLTYKTYGELVSMFREQGALPPDVITQAIENTNLLYDLTEDFELDKTMKYPVLYGSAEKDDAKFTELVEIKFAEKLETGMIPREQETAFRESIQEEMRVFRKLGMTGFMLSMSELLTWCREKGFAVGTARGSVGGSRVAYVADIIDLNPETWQTVFSRFCNEDRLEIGDIDVDVIEGDRPHIFRYITERFGAERTARVAAYGTVQGKKAIEDIGRCLESRWRATHGDKRGNPYTLDKIKAIKKMFDADEEAAKRKYPELFYFMPGLIDTKVAQSVHPAGIVISPISLDDHYGVFDKEGESCLMMDMEEAHEVGVAKYDFLVLKTVQVIRDACRYAGVRYPRSHEINWHDGAVWESISKNPSCIFQFESKFAADCLKKFKAANIFDMSLVTACIRPSGASYRDSLLARRERVNNSELISDLLKDNLGYLVYQEDTIKFLQQVCGLSGSEADNVRRAIGRKNVERLNKALPSILEGYCSKSPKPREEAEKEAKEFLQIIEDSANYQFGYNHSIAYCLLGYYCGYFRHYHPYEFITSYLNNAANDDDVLAGTNAAKSCGIVVTPPKWGFSRGDYFFDKEKGVIAKGLTSIKYMSANLADELYGLSRENSYTYFVDLLSALFTKTCVDSRQLDILIKIDFFSEFGNQRELFRIVDLFAMFKRGEAKQVKKTEIDGTPLEPAVKKHAVGVTKSGGVAKSYTLLDVAAILRDAELMIKSANMPDLSDTLKVKNFSDVMGYAGYVSGREEDRRKLYVSDVFPVSRKKDGKQFGYSVVTKSIGSGKDARFTVFNGVYNKDPIKGGDIIFCKSFIRDGPYFTLTAYEKVLE